MRRLARLKTSLVLVLRSTVIPVVLGEVLLDGPLGEERDLGPAPFPDHDLFEEFLDLSVGHDALAIHRPLGVGPHRLVE